MPDGRNKLLSAATRSAVSRARAVSGSEWAPEALPELAALMTAGRLTVPVWRGYPLAQAAAAHADLEARRNHGKIILIP
jgi:NADPH:quinone reductase-like Zn-dependent oxidoreductase